MMVYVVEWMQRLPKPVSNMAVTMQKALNCFGDLIRRLTRRLMKEAGASRYTKIAGHTNSNHTPIIFDNVLDNNLMLMHSISLCAGYYLYLYKKAGYIWPLLLIFTQGNVGWRRVQERKLN